VKIPSLIRTEIAQDSGDNDVWGWAYSHLFDVAFALYFRGESIPPEWKFRNPPPLTEESRVIEESCSLGNLLDFYDAGDITGDELRETGRVLSRYLDHLKYHGRDY
jgi:hypothetical protein